MKKCPSCGAEFDDTGKFCPYCGTEYGAEERPAGSGEEPGRQPEQPKKEKKIINTAQGMMLWHKIVLFLVGIKAARCLVRGASVLSRYVDKAVPDSMTALRDFFLGIGIVNVAVGVFALIVLSRLGRHMRSGPGSVKILYGMSIAGALILSTWLTSVLPNADISKLGLHDSILTDVILLIVNSIYYGRRKDAFVN